MAYTDIETHIDERTVPMYNDPRVLSKGINAGMAEKIQKKRIKSGSQRKGWGECQALANFPNP
jgi:hypothetical protein